MPDSTIQDICLQQPSTNCLPHLRNHSLTRQQETSPRLTWLGHAKSYGKFFLRLLPSFLGECLHCFTHCKQQSGMPVETRLLSHQFTLAASLASFSDHIPPVPLPSLCSLGMGLQSAKSQPGTQALISGHLRFCLAAQTESLGSQLLDPTCPLTAVFCTQPVSG